MPIPNYLSLGALSVTLQSDPDLVRLAIKRAGVEPVEYRNGVAIFHADVLDRVRAVLVERNHIGRIAQSPIPLSVSRIIGEQA